MVEGGDAASAFALMVLVALLVLVGMVTLAGALTVLLLVESLVCTAPGGAGPLSVTVPMDDCAPPITLVGFNVSEETTGGGVGVTGSTIVWPLLTCTCEMCCPP